jgi:sarcosine oxidase gamma subunit
VLVFELELALVKVQKAASSATSSTLSDVSSGTDTRVAETRAPEASEEPDQSQQQLSLISPGQWIIMAVQSDFFISLL